MDRKASAKIWATALNAKTSKYYAIKHFINPEKTWNAYFKAMKSLDSLVSVINGSKFDERILRKALSLGNEIAESYTKESVTRMVVALAEKESLPKAKTLLEWLGLLWKQPIPEADIQNVPWSIELAEKLQDFSGKKC